MAVEVQRRDPPQCLHYRRADAEVGYEVAVHHVDVERVGDPGYCADRVSEVGEIGCEN
jgi:hypothetical protein